MAADPDVRLAAPGVWERVLSLVGDCRGKLILDAPAGSGELSEMLVDQGATVVALDILPADRKGARWVQADLNATLPFASRVFDLAICIEGIEHLENPSLLLREFGRVVKDQGVLVITTPNVLNLRSRIKFLLTGTLFWFDEEAIERYGHISPIQFQYLKAFAERAGFRVEEVAASRRVPGASLLAPLKLVSRMLSIGTHNDPTLLEGEIVAVRFRKSISSPAKGS